MENTNDSKISIDLLEGGARFEPDEESALFTLIERFIKRNKSHGVSQQDIARTISHHLLHTVQSVMNTPCYKGVLLAVVFDLTTHVVIKRHEGETEKGELIKKHATQLAVFFTEAIERLEDFIEAVEQVREEAAGN